MRSRAGAVGRVVLTLFILVVLLLGGALFKGFLIGAGIINPKFSPTTLRMITPSALDPEPHFDSNTNSSMNYPRDLATTRVDSSPLGALYMAALKPGEAIGVSVQRNPPKGSLGANLMLAQGKSVPLAGGITGTETDIHSITVDGLPAYLVDLDLSINGAPARCRAILMMTSDHKLYTVMGMATVAQWNEAAPVFESSLSTFHLGSGAPRLDPAPVAYAPPERSAPENSAVDAASVNAILDRGSSSAAPAIAAAPDAAAPEPTVPIAASDPPGPPDAALKSNDPPAPAPVPIPASPTPDSVADAVTRLKHPDWNTRYQSTVWLDKQKPAADNRAAVAGALADLLADNDVAIHTAAVTALHHWADASVDQTLAAKIPDAKGEARHELLDLAATLKTPALAEAVAPLLADADERLWTRRCLLAMGPVAEKAVDGQLENEDPAIRREACHLLETIGTRASIPALKAHLRVTEKDDSVQSAATVAIAIIQSRGK